jgi:hypothetical protein
LASCEYSLELHTVLGKMHRCSIRKSASLTRGGLHRYDIWGYAQPEG